MIRWSLVLVASDLFTGAATASTAGGDPKAGSALFQDRCAICHAIGGGQGPSLKGVIGRKAASVEGFTYTPPLKASGLTWTAATLEVFLTNPAKAVPGTAMPIRVNDPKQRADLIAYLATNR